MLVNKNYDPYFSPVHVGIDIYPGLLIEKTCDEVDLSSEKLDPMFIQGTSAFKLQGVAQNSVIHSQIRGEINPFVARDGQAGRYKGIYNSDLLVSGEAVAGNCEQIVSIGDSLNVTTCHLQNESPMSLFYLHQAEKVRYGVGIRIRYTFSCIICYLRPGTSVPVVAAPITQSYSIGFNPYITYNAEYIKTLIAEDVKIQATNACLKCYLENYRGTDMQPSPLERTNIESNFHLILSMFRNKFYAFNAMLLNSPSFLDPLYEFRMGYCADEAIQGNFYIVESNMLEMWKENLSGQFGSEIKEWSHAISKLSKNRKGHTRRVAKSYLATTYGSQLTLNDMEQWKNAIEKYMWRSYNAREIAYAKARNHYTVGAPDFSLKDGSIDYNYSLAYDPLEMFGGNLDMRNTLRSFRLTPNEKRTWEIIPFSFVVDWFLPISDYLQTIESENTLFENNFRIFGEVNSVKMVFPFKEFPSVELVAYVRNCSKLPITKPFPNLEELNPAKRGVSGSAYLNGAALILSRGKSKPK